MMLFGLIPVTLHGAVAKFNRQRHPTGTVLTTSEKSFGL
jgi:hypothetical protein